MRRMKARISCVASRLVKKISRCCRAFRNRYSDGDALSRTFRHSYPGHARQLNAMPVSPLLRTKRDKLARTNTDLEDRRSISRKMLYMASLTAVQHNHGFEISTSDSSLTQTKKLALLAVARKLLITAYALIVSQQPYDPTTSNQGRIN